MNERKKQLKLVFDEVSSRYNSNRFFDISATRLCELFNLEKNHQCLDISTGTGLIACKLASYHPEIEVHAIDLSEGMLQQAKKNALALGLENITFTEMDAEALQYSPASFDVISCGYGLFFLPDMVTAFSNMYQLLKPGGRLIFSSFTDAAFSPYDNLFLERINKYGVKIPEFSWKLLKTEEHIRMLCGDAGIDQFQIETHSIRYVINADEWWQLLNSAGYKGLLNQITDDQKQIFKQEHLYEIRQLGDLELNADSLYVIVEMPDK